MPERLFATPRRAAASAVTLSAIMLCSFALSSYSLVHARQVSCAGRDKAMDVMRDILTDARQASASSPKAQRFYTMELTRVQSARC